MAEEKTVQIEKDEKVAPAQVQPEQPAKKRAAPRKKATATKKPEIKSVLVKSKRKSAVARASSKTGTGKIRLNSFDINTYEPIELRRLMLEPINVSASTHEWAKKLDISISVYGGGQSGQAQAVRCAIAKSIYMSSGSDAIKREYLSYDRFMLIDDARRVEPKKFKGPKARARFQKSYR